MIIGTSKNDPSGKDGIAGMCWLKGRKDSKCPLLNFKITVIQRIKNFYQQFQTVKTKGCFTVVQQFLKVKFFSDQIKKSV
jgi:hypothetical protein